MNILYVAYSCDPFNGSEDQIGWNIPNELSSNNNVFVITKIEQKKSIEKYLQTHNCSIRFYYVDINSILKKMFNGFFYSGRLFFWQKKATRLAKKICIENKIDIIHQLTPVELRAIGNYGKIKKTRYVVGPIGGGAAIPEGLVFYSKNNYYIEKMRKILNKYAVWKYNFSGMLKRIDYIMYSNKETRDYFNDRNGELLVEVGISKNQIESKKTFNNKHVFLVVGRLIYIKGFELLFDALELMPINLDYEVRIIGEGPLYHELETRINSSTNLSKHVRLIGKIDFQLMKDEYRNAHTLIMPSIRENTGTVLIEAISNGLPVIAMNRFGAQVLLSENEAWLYDGKSKKEFINNFSYSIQECILNSKLWENKSKNALKKAAECTWEKKSKHYFEIYKHLL